MAHDASAYSWDIMTNMINNQHAAWNSYLIVQTMCTTYAELDDTLGETTNTLLTGAGKILLKLSMMVKFTMEKVDALVKSHNRILSARYLIAPDNMILLQNYVFFFWMQDATGEMLPRST